MQEATLNVHPLQIRKLNYFKSFDRRLPVIKQISQDLSMIVPSEWNMRKPAPIRYDRTNQKVS